MGKILWVEDNPDNMLYGLFTHDFDENGNSAILNQISTKIVFAYDLEMAKTELKRPERFSSIFLDGDFPNQIMPNRKKYLDDMLQKEICEKTLLEEFSTQEFIANNFKNLFDNYIPENQKLQCIVYSMSQEAIGHAYDRRIPFYSKSPFNESADIKKMLEHHLKMKIPKNVNQLKGDELRKAINKIRTINPNWECGSNKNFFKKYIAKLA